MIGRTRTAKVARPGVLRRRNSCSSPDSGPGPCGDFSHCCLRQARPTPTLTTRWPISTPSRPRNSAVAVEYVNKAVDYYKKAMALDPSTGRCGEELAEFYLRSGSAEKAVDLANQS